MLPAVSIVFICLLISTTGGSEVVLGILGKSAFIECQLPISKTLAWQTGDGNVIAINGKVTNENSTKYMIEKQNGFRESLVIHDLTLADDNIFKCFDLKNSTFVDTTKLNVLARPLVMKVTTTPRQPMLEGTEVTFTCEADGGKPLPEIEWFIKSANGSITEVYGNITDVKYTNGTGHRNNVLSTTVTRDMYQSTFICNVTVSLLYQETLTVDTDVLLAPLQPEIASAGYDGSFDENSVLKLECTSAGSRPTSTIYWLLNGNRVGDVEVIVKPHENGTFTVASNISLLMSRDFNGSVLICAVTNKVLQDQGLPPRMANITLLASYKPTVSLDQNEYTTKLGNNVTLRCLIDANPLPKFEHLYWTHKGAMIDRKYYTLSNGSDIFSLTLQDVKISDAGNYSCHAINRLGSSASGQVKLTVLYAPVCDFKSAQKLAVRRGMNAQLNCNMHASPSDVIFTWRYKQTDERIKRMQGTVDTYNIDHVYSTLELTMGTQLRYAEVECYGNNTEGVSHSPCVFEIVPPSPPETPSNCSISADNSQVQMICQAGFNGGSTQHFILQKLGSIEFETLLTADTPDFVFPTFENVTIRMCAYNDDYRNMKNCARPTSVVVNVLGQPQSDPVKAENSHRAAYIAGGVVAGVGAITIAAIIAVLLFRRYKKEKSSRNKNNLESGSANQAIQSKNFRKWWKSISLERIAAPFRKAETSQPATTDVRHIEVVTDIDDDDTTCHNLDRLASTPYHPLKFYRIDRKANCSVFDIASEQVLNEDRQAAPDVLNESTGFALSPIVTRNYHENKSFQAESPTRYLDEVIESRSINERFNDTTDVGVSNCYNTEDMLDVLCESDARELSRVDDTETDENVCVKTLFKEYTDGDIADVLGSSKDETNTGSTDAPNGNESDSIMCEVNNSVSSVNETAGDFDESVTILKFMNVDFSTVDTEDEIASKVNNIDEESFNRNSEELFDKSILLRSPISKSTFCNNGSKDVRLAKANSLPYRLRKQQRKTLSKVISLSNIEGNHDSIASTQNQLTSILCLGNAIKPYPSDKGSSDSTSYTKAIDIEHTSADNATKTSGITDINDTICDIDEFTLTLQSESAMEYGSKEVIDSNLGDTFELMDYSETSRPSTMKSDYSDTPIDIDEFTLTITSESGRESATIVQDTEKDQKNLNVMTSLSKQNADSPEECDTDFYSPRREVLRRESFLEAINNVVDESKIKSTKSEGDKISVKIECETEDPYFNYGYEMDSNSKSHSDGEGKNAIDTDCRNENNDGINVVAYF